MYRISLKLVTFCLLTLHSFSIHAEDNNKPYITTRIITHKMAQIITTEAEKECAKRGYQIAVAVVDRYGNLISFLRHPLAGSHTIQLAQDKAFTSATFQAATIDLISQIEFLKGTPHVSLIGGGVPIKIGGYMYGSVGVSGAPAEKIPGDIDHECAMAGINIVREEIEFGN